MGVAVAVTKRRPRLGGPRMVLGAEMADANMRDRLRGREAELVVSDPWDVVGSDGSNVLMATIVDVDTGSSPASGRELLLVKRQSTLMWKGRGSDYFVVEGRYEREVVDSLLGGQVVFCNATAVLSEDAASGPPWGVDKWRGGTPAATGSLRLKTLD